MMTGGDLVPTVGEQGKMAPKDDMGHHGRGGRRFTGLDERVKTAVWSDVAKHLREWKR